MKLSKLLLATGTASLLSGAALAQGTSSYYLEAGVGQARASVDCAGTTVCDRSDTSLRLIAGYTLSPQWALELSFARLGRIRATAEVPEVGTVQASARLRSVGIGVAGTLPLNDSVALVGRLGIASNKTSVSGSSGGTSVSDSETRTAPYVGAGLDYALSKTVSLGLSADRTEARYQGEKTSVTSFGAGVKLRF